MKECMDAVEMSVDHAMEVFQLLSGILLIGDLVRPLPNLTSSKFLELHIHVQLSSLVSQRV